MKKFLEAWKKWSIEGMNFPFLHDPVTKKPSITLLFPYITFTLTVISLILLHIWQSLLVATAMSMLFWVLSTVFYMLRKLHKAKIDLNDQSIELDGGDSE